MATVNTPMYDEKGRRIWWAETWRIPNWPFARPTCHCGAKVKRIGWNLYRCTRCATRMEPERLWHRLMFKWNPFGASGFRYLFRVVRITHRVKPTYGDLL